MAEITASEKLMELIFKGLDHGIYSIKDGDGPLIPFVITQTNGEIEMKRFMAETIEESVSQAKKYLKELSEKPELAIMAYDGMLTIEGIKYDAIMVDGYEINDSKGYCFAQRYKPKKFLSRFKEIGNTAFIDEFENILTK
ncbi:MAG: hypothetical protein ACK46Y_15340 [Fluviicola sp.]